MIKRLKYLTFLLVIFSCNNKKIISPDSNFYKEWKVLTVDEINKVGINNLKCKKIISKKFSEINYLKLREKAIDSIFKKVKQFETNHIQVVESFFSNGITYSLTLIDESKEYRLKFEGDYILKYFESESSGFIDVKTHNQFNVCKEKHFSTSNNQSIVFVSSLNLDNKHKIDDVSIR